MSTIKISDYRDTDKRYIYTVDLDSAPLGTGGMGKVYRGERLDTETHHVSEVAIKFIFDNQPESVIDRARREAAIRLRNDNLVEMIDFVEVEQEVPHGKVLRYHVVSELLRGVMLLDLLKGRTTDAEGNVVPYAEELYELLKTDRDAFAVQIVTSVLNGVMALHNAGYIHRDLDPSNIMITDDHKIKIIDFGIAKQVSTLSQNDRHLTSVGQFMGKAAYAAPELISGDLQNQNQTTDLYAIGILLYVLIVGEMPFTGTLAEIMNQQLTKPIPIKNISNKKIRNIVEHATAKIQSKRYNSAARFIVDLENTTSVRPKTRSNDKSTSTSTSTSNSAIQPIIWIAVILGGLVLGFGIAMLF